MQQKGQTLVEVLVALTAGVIIISAVVLVVITSLRSVSFSNNQTVSSQLVDQGVQIMKKMKEENWTTFTSYAGNTYCLALTCDRIVNTTDDSCWIASSINNQCVDNIATASGIFTRTVLLENNIASCNPPTPPGGGSINGIKATIKVTWSDSTCSSASDRCHEVESVSCMTNLNAVQALIDPTPTATFTTPTPFGNPGGGGINPDPGVE